MKKSIVIIFFFTATSILCLVASNSKMSNSVLSMIYTALSATDVDSKQNSSVQQPPVVSELSTENETPNTSNLHSSEIKTISEIKSMLPAPTSWEESHSPGSEEQQVWASTTYAETRHFAEITVQGITLQKKAVMNPEQARALLSEFNQLRGSQAATLSDGVTTIQPPGGDGGIGSTDGKIIVADGKVQVLRFADFNCGAMVAVDPIPTPSEYNCQLSVFISQTYTEDELVNKVLENSR